MIALVASKAGRWLSGAFVVSLGLAVAALRLFRAGRQAERIEQHKQTLRAIEEKRKSDEEIDRMSAAERRRRLSDRWSR